MRDLGDGRGFPAVEANALGKSIVYVGSVGDPRTTGKEYAPLVSSGHHWGSNPAFGDTDMPQEWQFQTTEVNKIAALSATNV